MTSNSTNMTLEEKIVQTIKDTSLMQLVGDEDAITKLVTRAITEALFKDVEVRDPNSGYGGSTIRISPVIQAAREVAKQITDSVGKTLADDPEVQRLVRNAIIDYLPIAAKQSAQDSVTDLLERARRQTLDQIIMLKNNRQI